MKASEKCLAVTTFFENWEPESYPCSGGHLTIGWGHVLLDGEKFDEPITEEVGKSLLRSDYRKAEYGVLDKVSTEIFLTQFQFDALVDWTFNLGIVSFAESTMLKRINEGDILNTMKEMKRWIHVRRDGVKFVEEGLVLRREIDAMLYAGNLENVPCERIPDFIEDVRKAVFGPR